MKSLPLFLAACGISLALSVGISGGAAAQPSAAPNPPDQSAPVFRRPTPPAAADDLINADYSLKQREDRLAALLQSSLAEGSLGKAEYDRASGEMTAINATEDRLRKRNHGQLTDSETFRLEGRIKALAASLQWNR